MTTTEITTDDLLDQLNQHLAEIIKERDELRAAVQKFVDAYADGKAERLGNGQARRSFDEFRQLLTPGKGAHQNET